MNTPTNDALFAREVEQKVSNLLPGFGAAHFFPERTEMARTNRTPSEEATETCSLCNGYQLSLYLRYGWSAHPPGLMLVAPLAPQK